MVAGALAATACSTPQYTVVNPQQQQTVTTTESVEWPALSKWESGSDGNNDVGIIVAIEDYAFLPDVPGAIENANDWESYLKTARGASKVYTLTNKQATSEEIQRFIKQAAGEAGADSTVWFVFIGHGAPAADGKDGALVAMDAQQTVNSLQSRSVKRTEVLAALETGQQSNTVVILDTCFSGKDPSGNLLAKGTQPVIPLDQAQPTVTGNTVVLTAAASNEIAGQLPGAERPAFSYLLLGAMRGWADSGDGTVQAQEAADYVTRQFRHLKGRQQTPGIFGTGNVVLAKSAAEKDPGVADFMKGEGKKQVVVTQQAPVDASGGKIIDTNEGLVFTQPDGWAIGPAGMGVILTMQSMHGGSQIAVSRYETSPSNAAAMFQNSNDPSMMMDGTKVVQEGVEISYGKYAGSESIREVKDETFGNSKEIIFSTYQAGAAYQFQLKITKPANEAKHRKVFESFVANAQFKMKGSAQVTPTPAQQNERAKMQLEMFKFFYKEAVSK